MELTKTKLHNILKKYKVKLEQHDKEWKDLCRTLPKNEFNGDNVKVYFPTLHQYERHNCKGAQLFKDIMKEFESYEVFPKKNK